MKYVHTNIIAKDYKKLLAFYENVFDCKRIKETRDLQGEWLDRLTGITHAHIVGEHLCFPGYEDDHPTLEIFSYEHMDEVEKTLTTCGIAHLAFEVEDVEATLQRVLQYGGTQVGELVTTEYANRKKAVFVYVRDCEGNIVELQSWS